MRKKMCLSYLFNSYKIIFIVIILALNVISVLSKSNSNEDITSINVMTLPCMEIDNYDVTTIYKITDFENLTDDDGYKNKNFGTTYRDKYSIDVHQETNAIGLPIRIGVLDDTEMSNNTLFQDNDIFEFYSYEPEDWDWAFTTNMGETCDPETNNYLPDIVKDEKNVECLKVMEYKNLHGMQHLEFDNFLNITWTPQIKMNSLAIEYVFTKNALYNMIIYIYDEKDVQLYFSDIVESVSRTTLIITNEQFAADKNYTVVFFKHDNEWHEIPENKIYFGIYQVTSLHVTDNVKELTSTFQNRLEDHPKPFHVVGSSTDIRATPNNNTISTSNCLNGGYKIVNQEICICPPGFKGKHCEIGCGPNTYGADCTNHCSFYKKGCQGMYLCTSNFGCTCPTGLTGPLCDQKCPPHTYGNDCKQNCSAKCLNKTCNRYTGACSKGCMPPFMPPDCVEKYTYLLKAPELESVYENNITIKINFEPDNINSKNGHSDLRHYQILYKTPEETKYTLTKSKRVRLDQAYESYTIKNLKSDTTYEIGVLLIRNDGHFNDQNIKFTSHKTTCTIPGPTKNDYNMKLTPESKSINVTWDKVLPTSPQECRVTKYIITVRNKDRINDFTATYITNNNSYNIEDLLPNYQYSLSLTPWTSSGPLPSSPAYNFTPTSAYEDHDIGIENIKANTIENDNTIQVSWNFVNYDQNSYSTIVKPPTIVKYKINRVFSCSLEEVKSNWTSETVIDGTNFTISNLTSDAQYMIQVVLQAEEKDENIVHRKNIVYALTPATKPSLTPVLTEPLNIENNSLTVKWEIHQEDCSSLNGELLGFYVKLDTKNGYQEFHHYTKEYHYVSSYELKPDTDYEVRVHVLNDIGYNTECFLYNNFSTKIIKPDPIINDLLVYKKNIKKRMIGLRWKYLNATTNVKHLNKFKISLHGFNFTNETDVEKCSAWPEFYCYTINNLDLKNITEVKVKALDSPDGINEASVSFKSIDGPPDPPSNLQVTNTTNTTVTISWDIPWVLNGILKSFIISAEDIASEKDDKINYTYHIDLNQEQHTYNHTLTNLIPGSTYSISVVASTQFFSPPATIEITTNSTN